MADREPLWLVEMARRLPDDPRKRRLQVFKRCYQNMEHWRALMEDRGMGDVITTPEGEDIYLPDLLVGLDLLPRRQRQAFVLICLRGYTETDARDELLPNSKSSTPVQQYSDTGLGRMVDYYDCKQSGVWPPPHLPTNHKKSERSLTVMSVHPLLKKHLESARKDICLQMEGLQQALQQVETLLGLTSPPNMLKPPVPAPNPRPEGKPDVRDMAKELASTG